MDHLEKTPQKGRSAHCLLVIIRRDLVSEPLQSHTSCDYISIDLISHTRYFGIEALLHVSGKVKQETATKNSTRIFSGIKQPAWK